MTLHEFCDLHDCTTEGRFEVAPDGADPAAFGMTPTTKVSPGLIPA